MKTLKAPIIIALSLAIAGSLAAAFQAGGKLFVNGKLASSGVIEVKGTAYVPVKDVAKALNMVVSKSARGLELAAEGGATMVAGFEGKVGDELFNGHQRFKVLEVIRAKSYTNRYSGDSQIITPFPEGNDLVIAICRIKNGDKAAVPIGLPGGDLTALTDMKERSIAPRNGVTTDIPNRLVNLIPGSACEFALTFDVPPDAELKDLVYQVQDFSNRKVKPFRVSLKGK